MFRSRDMAMVTFSKQYGLDRLARSTPRESCLDRGAREIRSQTLLTNCELSPERVTCELVLPGSSLTDPMLGP